jgi:peptidyl-prolyl cis-trans isomerase SurA
MFRDSALAASGDEPIFKIRTVLPSILLALTLLAGTAAYGQNVQRIAAVVNDDAISVYDLLARLRMILLTTNLPDDAETRNRLAPQVLRSLIDERLQYQEAERLNIAVDHSEIEDAIRQLEGQLKVPEGGVARILAQANIPISTLHDQIRAQLAWRKVVQVRLSPNVQIGEEEIDTYLDDLKANLGKPQYRIGEIFLGVDKPANDVAVRDRARQLTTEIRSGASFPALARQFSESTTAAAGGDIGWVRLDQLQPELAEVVTLLKPGEVSDPVRTTEGYHILAIAGERNDKPPDPVVTVTLQQISLPFGVAASPADREAQIDLAGQVSEIVSGCDDLESAGREMGAQVSQRLADMKVDDLAPQIRQAVAGLPVNKPTRPIEQERAVVVAMVCERSDGTGLPSRSEVTKELANRKLNLLARRYMRDLRSSAFVDVRV